MCPLTKRSKDNQLKEAISLLKGWSVMSKVFKSDKASN